MTITVVVVGKKRTEFFESALAEYEKRLSRWAKLQWHVIARSDVTTESQQLMKYITNGQVGSVTVLLDERGEQWSTAELSDHLAHWQNHAVKNVLFIIGGSHGVDERVRDKVDYIWSLSRLIFPHQMVRLLLLEQLYRGYDMNTGGNYHHS
jgi:23S rRNA (pseudouridine1915-N3)-methyltransferase